jgi:hypothetical protein
MRKLFLLLVLGWVCELSAGENLLWPLPGHKTLTGGFGDSRTDHFHGGVDLRTSGNHLPVVAPSDGWIERIAVIPNGYGRVLYFRLEDGRTAVFGHLHKFVTPIEMVLRDSQLVGGTYRVDCTFPTALPSLSFQKGETLAYTGATGIGPPHLHFEIREGAVQTDPLRNYSPDDRNPPVISNLWWTTRSAYTPMTHGKPVKLAKRARNQYTASPIVSDEPIAFFLQTYDPNPWGRNSTVALIRIKVNNRTAFETLPSRIDLLGPKDIYGQLVLADRVRSKRDIRRLFSIPAPSGMQQDSLPSGWIENIQGAEVTIEVEDRAGNLTTVTIPVTAGPFSSSVMCELPDRRSVGRFTVESKSRVDLAYMELDELNPREVHIGPEGLGFSDRVSIRYHLAAGESLAGHYFYKRNGKGRQPLWRISEDTVTASLACTTLRAGVFGVGVDTQPPSFSVTAKSGTLRFRLTDGESGLDDNTIRCKVDGHTAIAEYEYDAKGGAIWTREPLLSGKHQIKFLAADRAGNVGTWSVTVKIR